MVQALFNSVQADLLQSFIDLKRAQGYRYTHQIYLLRRLDRLLCERSYSSLCLTAEIVEAFLDQLNHCQALSQSKMLSAVRDYSRFLHMRYPQSYVLNMPPIRAKRPSRFYIYSSEEFSALMKAASALDPPGSIRSRTVTTLLGLLYVSGLRIGEALALNIEDLDVNERTLFIHQGKFGKDRYVPLAASSVEALRRYRRKVETVSKDPALFISSKGTRFNSKTLGHIFRRLLRECGIATGKPWPRLHDLRHTFAVNCLCKWNDQGRDVNALLPVLSTVMGHVKVSCTQIYLHVPARLREQAAARFHHYVHHRILPER